MKTQSWALALALALATTTVAENRPRIYFPRHVKRQFSNGAETRDSVFPPATPAPKSVEDGQNGQNGKNDIRLPASNSDPADGFVQDSNNGGRSGQDPLATRSEEDSVLTINIPNTVVVQSTNTPSGKGNEEKGNDEKGSQGGDSDSDPQSRPTPQPASEPQNDSGKDNSDDADTKKSPLESSPESSPESSTDDDKGAVTIAPTGVVSEDPVDSKTSNESQDDASSSGKAQDPTDSTPTDTQPADDKPTSSADESKETGPAATEPPTASDPAKGEPTDPVSEGPVDNTPTPVDDEPTDTNDNGDGGLGGIIGGVIGGGLDPLLNATKTPDANEPADTTTPTKPTGADETGGSQQPSTTPDESDGTDPTGPTRGDDTVPPTKEPESDNGNNTDDEPTVITLPPILTDLPIPDPSDIPIPPLPPVVNDTNPSGNGTGGDDEGDGPNAPEGSGGIGVTVTLPPTNLPTNEPSGEEPNGPVGPGGDTTQPPVGQPTGGESTPGGEVTTPPTITLPGTDIITPTPPPTPPPGVGDGDGDGSSIGPNPTEPVGNSTNASSGQVVEPTQPPNAGPNVVEPATPVTSIAVLSTVTGTPAWLGTELVADQTASTQNQAVAAPAPTQSTETLPAGMPKTIEATEEDNPVPPEGAQLIRIVFDRRLHYEFVADNFTAAQQILTFLPKIISFGENVDASKIQMMRLAPVNSKNNGWFPTGAYLYVPASVIAPLSADIHLPNSLLYHHEYPVAFQLASAIDPSFGIMPGSEDEGDGDQTGPGGAPFSNSEDKPEEQTPQQQGATAGIAMGAVTVAVAYGAAMFIVARRYKRKKQAHRRASSITNTSDMRYSPSGSPAMMGGALLSRELSGYGGVGGVPGGRESHGSGRSGGGNSGRTAYISAPVAAENSLGWN